MASVLKSRGTDGRADFADLTRKKLVERLWRYMWFKPETEMSLAEHLAQLETADESKARLICDDLENTHKVRCEAGPLANCTEWIELRRKVGAPSERWG
jgi:hypothetical protein